MKFKQADSPQLALAKNPDCPRAVRSARLQVPTFDTSGIQLLPMDNHNAVLNHPRCGREGRYRMGLRPTLPESTVALEFALRSILSCVNNRTRLRWRVTAGTIPANERESPGLV